LDVITNPYKRKLTESELSGLLQKEKPIGLIAGTEPITAKVLNESAEYLRVVSRVGVGWDNVDHKAAKSIGIKIYRTPDATTQTVAELTLGLILSLLREINQMDNELKAGLWKKRMGSLLQDKKVGIIGFGRIGRRLAQLLVPFKVKIRYYDIIKIEDNHTGKKMSLDNLLAESDIVTLHVSVSGNNDAIMNEKELMLMKKGSWLVNASRGGVVDEIALYDALSSGHLSGAAIDVFESEPYTGPLTSLSNVILTPHIGSYASEARVRMETESVDNLIEGLEYTADL
jgi:D-3-phosphoglycerate dehydrogenase / 2-oxoglutarate reductase